MTDRARRKPPCDTCPCPAWGMECAKYQPPKATPAPEPTVRRTVELFLQSRDPGGEWETASSGMDDDEDYAKKRLGRRRQHMPDFEHRIVRRTTTVTTEEEPVDA